MEQTLLVSAIQDGTVIDHIHPGAALTIVYLLKAIESKNQVTVGLNLSSRSMKLKDLIKLDARRLTEQEIHEIAVFAPQATINYVKDYKIEKKIKATLPDVIRKILVCPNFNCITNSESVESCFSVEEFKNKINLRCLYCEKHFEREDIQSYKV